MSEHGPRGDPYAETRRLLQKLSEDLPKTYLDKSAYEQRHAELLSRLQVQETKLDTILLDMVTAKQNAEAEEKRAQRQFQLQIRALLFGVIAGTVLGFVSDVLLHYLKIM